ncbi:TIGR02281 family clan AA aspartic protease [uncultured Sphingomonas sp.]|uniref:retropepsin-like aspartic protease family protein n=1 Tax=uncultured Sphingomonas sp. TaxID=158754 RepID=UPI0025DEB0A5|nr:TIGR02281 family clan AA aspartic protease [uncultured Sphingomonas sp.]
MSDDSASFLWGIGALVLVLSALSARRLSFGQIVRSALGWIVIFAVATLAFANRDRIAPIVTDIGERLGIGGQTVVGDTVRIQMSEDGHFWARVTLNGVEKRMLVDSGATITAVSEATAAEIGIEPNAVGFPVVINTANGSVTARRGRVERVSLGMLETKDLGVVVSPTFGDTNVLGMNFLSRLGSWRVEGRTLILEPKRIPQN